MPISNITRTNTVDEWRIQTNLSANALNKIETGNYDKISGSLNIACTAVLTITSSGTGLSVANNALVSGDFTVGKSIALGSEGASTGNLTVGANTFIYGRGAALFVANSAIVNVSIQATQSIRTNNFIANTDASITGTAQIGYLTVNNSTAIGTTLDVVGNTTVGNLVTANSVVGDNGRFSSNLVASHFVTIAGSLVADSARITSNATFGETTATTINATNARISGNANVAHVTATGSFVGNSARIAANATFGETTATTINATNARVSGNANVAHLTASASIVADNARITANTTGAHFIASGSLVADSARIAANATFGETTATTINTTNARITGNANVAHVTATGSLIADSARIAANATFGETTATTINTTNARISGNANVAHVTATGSLVADNARIAANATFGETTATTINTTNARITGNANVAHVTATGSLVADNARITANATFGETTATTINVTNARISGNANVAHVTATGSIVSNNARISANATFGEETTATTINSTNARISGNANVAHLTASSSVVADNARITANTTGAHFVASGSLVADNARITANATFGETTSTTINATNARISGNANVANLTASASVVADSLRITNDAGINGTLRVTGNSVFGNVNTANMMYAGSLRTVGRADIGSALTVGGDASVSGKLTVSGDFVLSGDIVYDTDVLSISTVTPVTTTGAAYYGVFRGNTTGGVTGHNGLANSDANAYIRWVASSNTWQIRDVFNADTGTSYSKILTANLISSSLTSTSTDTFLSSSGAKSLKDSINTEITDRQANVGAGIITVTNNYQANVGQLRLDAANANTNMKNYVDTANTNLKNYVDTAVTTANTNLKNYVDTANTNLKNYADLTFLPKTGGTISSDLIISGSLTVSGTVTTINTEEINLADNEIVLNSNHITNSLPTQNAGIIINRGNLANSPNVFIRFDEGNGYWVLRDNVGQFIIATAANVGVGIITANTNMKNYVDTRKTSNIAEETNLYYTDTRVRAAVGVAATFGTPLNYISSNGTFQHLNSGVTATGYGSASQVPVFVVNASGHITSVTNTNIAIASGAVSGLATSATTDTTNAANITSGTLPTARFPAFTGDITTVAGGVVSTLATVNTNTGGWGSASSVPTFVVNGKGLITAAGNVAIAIASSAVSGLATSATTDTTNAANITSGTLPTARFPAFTGDITTVAGGVVSTLANSGVTAQSAGSASSVSRFTVDAKGRITSANSVAISIASSAVSGLATSATTDTTNATNISSGTLAAARFPAFTGDITTVAGGVASTLATVNATTGNFGGASTVPVYTVNGKGLVTYAGNVAISIASSAVSGLATSATTDTTNATNISSGTLAAARFPAFTGDITTVAGGVASTLATVNATTGSMGSATHVSRFTVNGKGLITSANSVAIAIASSAVSGLATSATTDTTNATNITSGTLAAGRLGTTGAPQFGSLGVGTAASGTTGEILASGSITAGYSDDKLKTRLGNIENALDKVSAITGFYYEPNQTAQDLGYALKKEVGVSAQEVQAVLPEVVVPAPVDNRYLTVHYEKLIPLLVEAIKELKAEVDELKKK
jgi:hypothetical protein